MNNFKDRVEYLAQSYVAIAKRSRSWEAVKILIERNKDTEEAVKKRIKELFRR